MVQIEKIKIGNDLPDSQGIYAIINTKTHKRYIGSSVNVRKRIKQHITSFRRKKGSTLIQADFNKYGEEVFVAVILEEIKDTKTLRIREDHYIDLYNSYEDGYNIRYSQKKIENRCLSSRVELEWFDLMSEDAKKRGLSHSEWIREAVIEKVKKEVLT